MKSDKENWIPEVRKLEPRPITRKCMGAWRFKIVYEGKGVFWSLFWVKNFFKMISVFAIFASDDGKQLLCGLYVIII